VYKNPDQDGPIKNYLRPPNALSFGFIVHGGKGIVGVTFCGTPGMRANFTLTL
jgi:hypothetical protein